MNKTKKKNPVRIRKVVKHSNPRMRRKVSLQQLVAIMYTNLCKYEKVVDTTIHIQHVEP